MQILTEQQILDADDIKIELVPCPEWGGAIYVKTLDGLQREEFEQSIIDSTKQLSTKAIRAKLVAAAACDKDGKPIFSPDAVEKLARKSSKPLDRAFTVAQRLSGMGAEDIEALRKNSGAGLDAGDGSASA